ncbi:helix-turn-helix transcriptional regulator, partial [Mesorhizobium sp.]|uniref:helix-turn-helix transcriptional regulator n=1 Tax=Mesorhizobium sp. TaxID=1871066 RepID=UPI0025FEB378
FMQDDVNKWVELAGARSPANSLYLATKGRLEQSSRYRDICVPLGFGDELRAALRLGNSCWGFMCLHRERKGPNFSLDETEFLAALTSHLAEGLRGALLLAQAENAVSDDGPGLLLLSDDLSVVSSTVAGEHWLAEIADSPDRRELPQVIYAAVARLTMLESNSGTSLALPPRARVQTRPGQWLIVHASRLSGRTAPQETAVILEPARPEELAPLLLQAYGLTRREAEVAQLVLRGVSTAGIAATLLISDHTVQQHLKAVFDKIGVASRRELVAQVFAQQYRPRMRTSLRQKPPSRTRSH